MIRGKRILIVEDEFLIAEMGRAMLTELGAVTVGPASTVNEGLALVAQAEIDAVVLDINLFGQRSDPVAALLTEKNIPYVIASGYEATRFEKAGVPVLSKPYDLSRLRNALEELFS